MKKNNIANLMQEILKFREHSQGGQTNQISQDRLMICAGDWAQFQNRRQRGQVSILDLTDG